MPKLIRLYIQSVAIGFGLSAGFAVLMVGFDVMGIGHLILGSSSGLVALAMLIVFNGVVFSGVQFGLRVMLMAADDTPPRGGLRQHLMPLPVRAETPARSGATRRR